jgi:hypothetical protein
MAQSGRSQTEVVWGPRFLYEGEDAPPAVGAAFG